MKCELTSGSRLWTAVYSCQTTSDSSPWTASMHCKSARVSSCIIITSITVHICTNVRVSKLAMNWIFRRQSEIRCNPSHVTKNSQYKSICGGFDLLTVKCLVHNYVVWLLIIMQRQLTLRTCSSAVSCDTVMQTLSAKSRWRFRWSSSICTHCSKSTALVLRPACHHSQDTFNM